MACLPLRFHPAVAVTNAFKQCHGIVAAHLRAEPLLGDEFAGASIAEVSSPKEEAKLRSHQAHTTLYALVVEVGPPLPLGGAEAGHGEDEVHGFEGGGGSRPSNKLTISQKGPLSALSIDHLCLRPAARHDAAHSALSIKQSLVARREFKDGFLKKKLSQEQCNGFID